MHDNAASGKNMARKIPGDDHKIGFDLGFDAGARIDDQRVSRKDLSFELTADSDRTFKAQLSFEGGALIEKSREMRDIGLVTSFLGRRWRQCF